MEKRNVILTGPHRSGTTLVCHLLNRLPNLVALHEPMQVGQFPRLGSQEIICDEIARFFATTRSSIETRGIAPSKHVDGAIPDNDVGEQRSSSGLRMSKTSHGEVAIRKPLAQNFVLVIKHPAAFTAILGSLVKRFPSYAIVRNPLAVLASWNSVAFAVREGHAPAAERLDAHLAQRLGSLTDGVERQLYLLSWYYGKYLQVLPQESIIRYEDIVASGGKALRVIVAQANELNETLESKNTNSLYDRTHMRVLGEKLLRTDGAFWEFYSKESVQSLLAG